MNCRAPLVLAACFAGSLCLAGPAETQQPASLKRPVANTVAPMQVVLANITAFNRRDLEAFLSTYASDAQMIDLPSGRMLTTGTATLRERYRDQFENDCLETMGVACPDLQVTIVDTQTVGNYVIAKEAARLKKDTPPLQLVVIYEVINARISRAWFIGK